MIFVNKRKWFKNLRRTLVAKLPTRRKRKRAIRKHIRNPKRRRQRQQRRTLWRGRSAYKKRPKLSWRVQTMLIRDPDLRRYLFDRFTTKRTLMASHLSG